MNGIIWLFGFTLLLCQHTSIAQDDLDALRKNIPGEPGKDYPTYGINILCKINPRNPGCGGGGGGRKAGGGGGNGGRKGTGGNGGNKGGAGGNGGGKGGARAGGNGGGAGKRNGQNGAPADSTKNRNNKGAKADYEAQIAQGNIPGTAGKDYPVNSLAAWRKRPGFENIELAPDHLVVAGYPGLGGGNGGRKGGAGGGGRNGGGKRKSQPPASSSSASTTSGGGGYCPGGSLQDCIRFCPSDDDGQEFSSCVTDCGNQCPT